MNTRTIRKKKKTFTMMEHQKKNKVLTMRPMKRRSCLVTKNTKTLDFYRMPHAI